MGVCGPSSLVPSSIEDGSPASGPWMYRPALRDGPAHGREMGLSKKLFSAQNSEGIARFQRGCDKTVC